MSELRVGGEKWLYVNAYGSGSENREEVRNRIWEDLSHRLSKYFQSRLKDISMEPECIGL